MTKKKTQTLKIEKPHILKKAEDSNVNLVNKKITGRPKVSVEDKLSEAIALKFTPKEKELLLLKAGDVPLATFIKN